MSPKRGGFTLIELLVVVTIIGILIGLMFPIYSTAIRSVEEVNCQGNIGQLAKVVASYCQANDGFFPFLGFKNTAGTGYTAQPTASDWLFIATSNNKLDLVSNTLTAPADMERGLLVKNKLVGKLEAFYCPSDVTLGLIRGPASKATSASGDPNLSNYLHYQIYGSSPVIRRPATSYVMNSAITYGDVYFQPENARRVRRYSDFGPNTFMFIEESSGNTEAPTYEMTSLCNRGFMGPEDATRELTSRHRWGGYVACMDGHVEWFPAGNPCIQNTGYVATDPANFTNIRAFVTTAKGQMGKDKWYFTPGTRWGP